MKLYKSLLELILEVFSICVPVNIYLGPFWSQRGPKLCEKSFFVDFANGFHWIDMELLFKLTKTTFRNVQDMGPQEPYFWVLIDPEQGQN